MAVPTSSQRYIGKVTLVTGFPEVVTPVNAASFANATVKAVIPGASVATMTRTADGFSQIYTLPFEVNGSFNASAIADALDRKLVAYVDSMPSITYEGERVKPYDPGAVVFGAASATKTNTSVGIAPKPASEPTYQAKPKPPAYEPEPEPDQAPLPARVTTGVSPAVLIGGALLLALLLGNKE